MSTGFPYIADQVGLSILCQPYQFSDAKMATFFLDSQADALNALLDTYINQPSNGEFEYRALAAGDKTLTLMIMARMTVDAKNPAGVVYGKERYGELSFWIPCYDRKAWTERLEFKPGLFLPFLFPDSFAAIATGREMFGFRKQLAAFRFPDGDLNQFNPSFTASTTAFKTLSPDTLAQQLDFLSLSSDGACDKNTLWNDIDAVADGVFEHFLGKHWTCPASGDTLLPIANHFFKDCPALFIKQFPAIENATQAASRQITAAPFELLKFHTAMPWLDLQTLGAKTFDLRIEKLASHPIVAQLGLTPTQSTLDADMLKTQGFWLDVDFQLDNGVVLSNVAAPKQKIAVLGGGIGSLAAAYGITSTPGWQDKYEITVYQMGWRLGGKGASGRNQQIGDRIEEHGLHIWFGYYENAFRVIQECYAALARPANAPLATWDQAFKQHNNIVVEEYVGDDWKTWALSFQPNAEVPGDGTDFDDHPMRFFGHLRELMGNLDDELVKILGRSQQIQSTASQNLPHSSKLESLLGSAFNFIKKPVEYVIEHEVDHFFSRFRSLYQIFPEKEQANAAHLSALGAPDLAHWHDVIAELQGLVAQLLQPFGEVLDSIRRFLTLAELALTIAKGMLLDGVLLEGYSAINQYDFTEWLIRHGASKAVANSALVRSFYDLYLGFPNGQNEIVGDGVAIGGNVAAGELLHSYILVTLCYKGAIMWKMQAGMGDVVMTPLYQVLKQRGVKFEFFNKVTDLKLSADQQQIGAIEIDVQATLQPGLSEYNPLYDVKGLPCWPSAPLYDQLVQGGALKAGPVDLESSWSAWQPVAKKTLRLGVDFDQVVLGISVAALPLISSELSAANPAWKTMLAQASTTQTQAMQLWLNIDLQATGWPLASPVLDAYGEPFNTWAVMDQTLDKENWPLNHQPFNIAYFCNNMKDADPIPPFSDHGFPEREVARVKEMARVWLKKYSGHLWPYAVGDDGKALDWNKLVDIAGRQGEARLDGQYFRANIEPTERYVCNAANTNQYRLKADASGFGNLTLTGDWINNGSLNLGCVESTVIAGLQAARAVTGYPLPIHHEYLLGGK